MSEYEDFLIRKSLVSASSGMRDDEIPSLPRSLKPFQEACVRWALKHGRSALFQDTGLGKTIQELSFGAAVAAHCDAPVLHVCPLAVAEQTIEEAIKFDISGVGYAQHPSRITAAARVVVTNYERFHHFDLDKFSGIVLDEAGILKHAEGKTRAALTEACRDASYKLIATATPAPNDYAELGQHAEFLGALSAKEMLASWFVHDGSIRADDKKGQRSADGWRLKRHARRAFWRWLASWAVVMRSPADLGFDGSEYELPPLNYHQTIVDTSTVDAWTLFPAPASTLSERIAARRDTVEARCRAAAEIVMSEPDEPWLVWCRLNAEADLMESLLPRSRQVAGKDTVEMKVGRLLGFKRGVPLHLVSKPSIAGHGLHWAHCARMVFVGVDDSFEQLYQSVRRCWRYGQSRPVHVHIVASSGESTVLANLRRKEVDFEAMLNAMTAEVRDLSRVAVRGSTREWSEYRPVIEMEVPEWLSMASPVLA